MVFVVARFSVLFFIVVSIRPPLVFLSLLFFCEIIKIIRSIFFLKKLRYDEGLTFETLS